ncbi:MAG: hypothetical protein QM671_12760 [Bacillus sp. (in: firmicutes)]
MEQQLGAEITALSASVVRDNITTESVLGALAGGMTGAVLEVYSALSS